MKTIRKVVNDIGLAQKYVQDLQEMNAKKLRIEVRGTWNCWGDRITLEGERVTSFGRGSIQAMVNGRIVTLNQIVSDTVPQPKIVITAEI